MYRDPMWLRDYSTDQLIEELARRRNIRDTMNPKHWCHDCTNFVAWLDKVPEPRETCPDNYNACTKGKVMKFKAPEEIGDEWGFYLQVCEYRDLKPGNGLEHQ